ncbi:hypothetical protein NDU88_006009 [Pleurodeles waltl]|uniref:Uncharacterized protein n=1 Tax=Pleurodeles waltl TaxID=8319 RepID=A0AAV7WDG4_PLEWA|nr:hypothetical protein NDU88_006009 [Pleurodeles waltl]
MAVAQWVYAPAAETRLQRSEFMCLLPKYGCSALYVAQRVYAPAVERVRQATRAREAAVCEACLSLTARTVKH